MAVGAGPSRPKGGASSLDRHAIVHGAIAAGVIAVPAGVVQNLVAEGSSVRFAMFLLVVAGFVLGGFVAGRDVPDRALVHGGLAALTVYVTVQAVGIVARLARGASITWVGIPLIALLSISCGIMGGYLAFRRSSRDAGRAASGQPQGDPG